MTKTEASKSAAIEKALSVYLALDKEVNKLHRKLNKLRIAEIESPVEMDRSIAGALRALALKQHSVACAAASEAHSHYMALIEAEEERAKLYA